jgi:zinc protease
MAKLHWTEVDHIKTVWTELPPPFRAGLFFRTGIVDETLMTHGITHLIEHSAFTLHDEDPDYYQAFVDGLQTGFIATGKEQDVSGYLSRICAELTCVPGDRLEKEKQVLAAEFSSRPVGYQDSLLNWRYGATGYGLLGAPELGLLNITLEQLREYSNQRFTSDNAILWFTGPIPKGLHLDLPRGEKHEIPELTPVLETFPSWYLDDHCGGVAAGAVIPRIPAARILCKIATRRLFKSLRQEHSLCYFPSVSYEHLDAEVAHIVFHADSEPSRREELIKFFGEALEDLYKIEPIELEEAQSKVLEVLEGSLFRSDAEQKMIQIQSAAHDWIIGKDYEPLEILIAKTQDVGLDELKSLADDINSSLLVALPSGVPILSWAGKMAPFSKWPEVQGRSVNLIDYPIGREVLIYGPDGVSCISANGFQRTVRFSDLAAAQCFDDGGIHLFGNDGTGISVEPTLWRKGKMISRKIRERLPDQFVIDQIERPVISIPQPRTTVLQRFRAQFQLTDRAMLIIILILMIMVIIFVYSYSLWL